MRKTIQGILFIAIYRVLAAHALRWQQKWPSTLSVKAQLSLSLRTSTIISLSALPA